MFTICAMGSAAEEACSFMAASISSTSAFPGTAGCLWMGFSTSQFPINGVNPTTTSCHHIPRELCRPWGRCLEKVEEVNRHSVLRTMKHQARGRVVIETP